MFVKTTSLAAALAALAAVAAAQSWGFGASYGAVNDVTHHLRLDEFHSNDVNGWIEYKLEPQVHLRTTFGTLKSKGVNAGESVIVAGSSVVLPDLSSKIDYVTIGTAYEFWEGDYTSGIFGGIGGYRIRPEPVPDALAAFRDQREKVFGWHLGVDANVRVISRLALVARLTYHNVRAIRTRSILTANGGFVFRF